MLKIVLYIILIFASLVQSFAQETTISDVFEFVPGAPQNKSELLNRQFNPNWSSEKIQNIVNDKDNSIIAIQTTEKGDTSLIVVWNEFFRDTLNYLFNYNQDGKFQKYHVNYKNCYEYRSSDIPAVIYSDVIITYTPEGKPLRVKASCITGNNSFFVDFYYNSEKQLDSIIKYSEIKFGLNEFNELNSHQFIEERIICSNENLFTDSLDFKSSVKVSYYEQNKLAYSYFYEFDSLERITAYFKLDANDNSYTYYNYSDLDDNTESEAYRFYYDDQGLLWGIDYSDQQRSRLVHWGHANRLIIYRTGSNNKITDLKFCNGDLLVGEYSKKKGWTNVYPYPIIKDNKRDKLMAQLYRRKHEIDSLLMNFPNDTVLLYSNYHNLFWEPDTTCEYLLKYSPGVWILSDTVNNIERYLLIQGDDILTTFYFKRGDLIMLRLWNSSANGINIYPSRHENFIAVKNEVLPSTRFKDTDYPELTIFGSGDKRYVLEEYWNRYYVWMDENVYLTYTESILNGKTDFVKELENLRDNLFIMINSK